MTTEESHDEYFIVSHPMNEDLGQCQGYQCPNKALYRIWWEKAPDIKENLNLICDSCLAKTVMISEDNV